MHGSGGTVLVRNIEFASTCEATLMPFHGQCHIAYHPSQPLVLGLSKLARLVGVHSKRLGSQQGLTAALHDAIATHMPSLGVFVYTRARHLASAASAAHSVCQSTSGCFASAQAPQAKVCAHCGTRSPARVSTLTLRARWILWRARRMHVGAWCLHLAGV